MKKFAAVILALLYLSSSTGAMVHMHYCMGKLADWGLGQNKSQTCGSCGMKTSEAKDKGCCKDEHKFVKNNADQKTAEAGIQLIQLIAVDLPPSFFEVTTQDIATVTEKYPISHAPPRNGGVAVYIRNCVFLI